jgi:large subunit ribosomal protein L21
MFAVIKTGGLQYSVAEDQKVRIGRIEGEPGQIVQIGNVLMLGGDTPELGSPIVSGASVAVEIIEQSRGAKVIAFKKRRRKNSRRKRGHRQDYTVVRISEILTGGASPTKGPKPKPERKPAPIVADGEEGEAKPAAKKKAAAKKPAAKAKAKAPAKKPAAKKKKS